MRFSFAFALGIGRHFRANRQGQVLTLHGIQAKRLERHEDFMSKAMPMLHGSIDTAIHCAIAA